MKSFIFLFLSTVLVSFTPTAHGKVPHLYPSEEIESDRRQVLYYNHCIDIMKRASVSDKDFSPIDHNQLMKIIMELYVDILAQEYPNGQYPKKVIMGVMQSDTANVMSKLQIEDPHRECYEQMLGFTETFLGIYNKYQNTAKPR